MRNTYTAGNFTCKYYRSIYSDAQNGGNHCYWGFGETFTLSRKGIT